MNPIVILVVGAALLLGWVGIDRVYNPELPANKKLDLETQDKRTNWLVAIRDLAFFFALSFMFMAICVLVASLISALFFPPPHTNFGDAYEQALVSTSTGSGPLNPATIWGALITFIATVAAVYVSQRFIRGQNILDLGLRPYKVAPLDVVAGLLFGTIVIAVIFFVERARGSIIGVSGPTYDWGALAVYLLTFLLIAVSEELVVRGYVLQVLNKGWDGAVAVVGSSIYWGLAHAINPGANVIGILDIIVAGLIFAYAYVLSGHLWLPIALHLAWNFAEGAIFGFPVSGFVSPNSVFQTYVTGPSAITGGNFGPEGSVLMVLALAVAGALLFGWSKVRQPPTPKPDEPEK